MEALQCFEAVATIAINLTNKIIKNTKNYDNLLNKSLPRLPVGTMVFHVRTSILVSREFTV